ncbi:MAG: ATP-binding protein [Promethearchaeota archaeon]
MTLGSLFYTSSIFSQNTNPNNSTFDLSNNLESTPLKAREQNLSIRVGFYENSPKIFTNEQNEYTGFFPDLLNYIANKEGWDITYIPGSWEEGLQRLESNEIDIMPDVGYSLDRAKLYEFNNVSIVTNWATIYIPRGSPIQTIQDLQNKRIGVMAGDIDYIGPNGITFFSENYGLNCTFVEYSNLTAVLENLNAEYIDAGVVNDFFGKLNAYKYEIQKTAIEFNPIDFKFAFPKNASLNSLLIEKIDQWLLTLKSNPDSDYYKLMDNYFAEISGNNGKIPLWVTILILGLLGAVALFISISYLLQMQVKLKTEEIKKDYETRIMTEKELEQSRSRFNLLVNQAPLGFIEVSPELKIANMNPAAERILGKSEEEIQNKSINLFCDQEIIQNNQKITLCENFKNCLEKMNFIHGYHNILKNNNNQVNCEFLLIPLLEKEKKINSIFVIMQDITQKIKFEEENLRKQKIESISFLAGGIAHDFNNMLMSLIGNVNLMQLSENLPEDEIENLTEMEKIIQVAKGITQQLLTFSKGGSPIKKPQNILTTLQDSISLTMHGSKSRCILDFHQNLNPICNFDKGQITQVFNNIILNAIQSMPKGGIIKIDLETIKVQELSDLEIYKENELLKENEDYFKISIQDQGIGIPSNLKSKMFQPYFTTKDKGNGLGLVTCYSVIKRHGGHITFSSEEEKGTTFYIFLPVSIEKEDEKNITKKPMDIYSGKVLLMDDERSVRRTIKYLLNKLGFEVDLAINGFEAIEKYKVQLEKNQKYDFVIFDLTIPGSMGGEEAIKTLIQIDPSIKAIVSSGYSNNPIMANHRKYGFVEILPKPFNFEELKKVISKIVNLKI